MLHTVLKKIFTKSCSKDAAKERLQIALVYDRLAVSDDLLTELQKEIVDVISRHFIIDQEQLTLDITRHKDLSALVLNTPIISAKTRLQRASRG